MTNKNRLMELFSPFADGTYNSSGIIIDGTKVDDVADHLLANGVIAPPCNVGDVVYMVTPNGNIRNLTVLGIDIELDEKESKMTCLAVYEYEGNPCYLQIQYSKFGKSVFLTKEEAEEKLEELKEKRECE